MKGKKEGLQGERWCLMETFKKRDDLLKVEKFTSPRKLERGGCRGRCGGSRKRNNNSCAPTNPRNPSQPSRLQPHGRLLPLPTRASVRVC